MRARRTYLLAGIISASLLLASGFAWADARAGETQTGNELTITEYQTELDQLSLATQQLDSSGSGVPAILENLPPSWRVHTEQQDFVISAEALRQDVLKFEKEKDVASAGAIRRRIQRLRDDLDGFETSPTDVSWDREHLKSILARSEFRDVRGPTFLDRLAQRLQAFLLNLLGFLFRSSAIPAISEVFVYALIGLAVLTLAFLAYRHIRSASLQEERVVPTDLPVSAKIWTLWLAEAHAAAAKNNWRDAIHLAYWAGISFLEHKGTWRPDRARTPREYLRLLSSSSEHRETLAALTHVFELSWYAKREADAQAFAQTMQALERLGCHSS
jgi:hypothetical protein